jgi:hypothetical protein
MLAVLIEAIPWEILRGRCGISPAGAARFTPFSCD